jgi:predicted GIY-YIG superfamily endonuclease
MEKQPCVYFLASKRNGTLYMGVTSNLVKRFGNIKFPGNGQTVTVFTSFRRMPESRIDGRKAVWRNSRVCIF